jgi:hypothetical protein
MVSGYAHRAPVKSSSVASRLEWRSTMVVVSSPEVLSTAKT